MECRMKYFSRVHRQSVAVICALSLIASSFAYALGQQTAPAKRALTHQDYDSWHSIQAPQISRDGRFVAYAFMAQDGDSEVVVRNLASSAEWRAPRGYHPPVPPPDDPGANVGEFLAAQSRLVRPVFTADAHFVVFSIEPTKAELNKAKKEKKKPEEMPKNALGIMDVSNGQVARIERVKNFQVPEDGSGFIAYLLEPKKADSAGGNPTVREGVKEPSPEASPSSQRGSSPTAGERGSSPTVREGSPASARAQSKEKKKEFGTDLILRNMTTGTERTLNDVLDYTLSKDAKTLAYTVSSKKEETNGVFILSPQSDAAPASLLAGKGKYQKLTWDEEQTELAFISDRDDQESKQPKFKVYLWDRGSSATIRESSDRNHATMAASAVSEVVSTSSPGFRKDFVVSDKANLGFSLDGSHLFLGAAPPPEPEKNADEEVPADEKVLVDLWHWRDDYVQPIQKIRAEQDRNRSFRAVFLTKDKKFIQLADESMETLTAANDGRYAVGSDNRAYRIASDYDPGLTDYYDVNTTDGPRKP